MNSKPLPYLSLKVVLQYLDANVRFEISNRIPSLKNLERRIPLRIERLQFSPYQFIVNDISYTLGTFRQYPNEHVPLPHHDENEEGGFRGDLDPIGVEDFSSDGISTPGDLVFLNSPRTVNLLSIWDGSMIEADLKTMELVWAQKRGMRIAENQKDMNFYRREEEYRDSSAGLVKRGIDELLVKLQPHLCRRDNVPLQYRRMIQLTIVKEESYRRIHRKENILKLYQVQKYLTTLFFANRGEYINVERLEIEPEEMIVRLPPNLKFKIRQLKCANTNDNACNVLQNVIHDSSYPLEVLKINRLRDFEHPLVIGAKNLVIGLNRLDEDRWLQFNLNRELDRNEFTPEEAFILIQRWIRDNREIGTTCTCEFVEEAEVIQVLNRVGNRFEGSISRNRIVWIPMSQTARIRVSYTPIRNARNPAHWRLKIKIMPVSR